MGAGCEVRNVIVEDLCVLQVLCYRQPFQGLRLPITSDQSQIKALLARNTAFACRNQATPAGHANDRIRQAISRKGKTILLERIIL